MTISVWLRRVDVGPLTMMRRSQSAETAGTFILRIDRFNRLSFSAEKESLYTTALNDLPENDWTYFAVTFDKGHVVLYVNGEARVSKDLELSEISAAPLNGSLSFGLNAPVGTLADDLGIFEKALSPEQIEKIYQSGLERFVGQAR
ncbi:MAG: LamG domain-containing protein [Chthoniobacterales bacterium]